MTIKELLSNESKWTKGVYARNADGAGVSSNAETAVSWCLLGALNHCYNSGELPKSLREAETAIYQALLTLPDVAAEMQLFGDSMPNPARWNDAPGRTFADVKRLVEQAGV